MIKIKKNWITLFKVATWRIVLCLILIGCWIFAKRFVDNEPESEIGNVLIAYYWWALIPIIWFCHNVFIEIYERYNERLNSGKNK